MEIGKIEQVDIDQQMRAAYLDYAMSVIVARALPDARDGLKPVHRRILYAMHDMGITATTAYKKSARIVGEVLGKYHPHGDAAVYESMARMAQDFSMRYLLIDGQGNFGSVDGDAPAAMRYTEARLSQMAEEMLGDIEQNTVDFVDNFDASLKEPLVLPARLPNLLLNGSSGIAVGMATNIPPHNLGELISAISYLIDHYEQLEEISADELLRFVPGPDFPTGGVIVGSEGIIQAYSTGRGRIVLRGLAHIEEMSAGRQRIVITEIPFLLNKSSLLERIAELAREGKLNDVSDLRDESDRRGMSIIIELRRGAQPGKVLNQLYKYTPLQSTFGVQMLALVDGEPKLLSLKRILQVYIDHRQDVIIRRSRFELDKARARAHILEGLQVALANLDQVIQTIRESPDAEIARERLISRFKLSEVQAQAILDLQLRRLAALERQKIEDEQQQTLERIAYLEDLLASQQKVFELIKSDLGQLAKKFSDPRRTRIAHEAKGKVYSEKAYQIPDADRAAKGIPIGNVLSMSTGELITAAVAVPDFVAAEYCTMATRNGKIKRVELVELSSVRPSGLIAITLDEGDELGWARLTDGGDELILVTEQGQALRYSEASVRSMGRAASGVIGIGLSQDDHVASMEVVETGGELLVVTTAGYGKCTPLTEYPPKGRATGGVQSIDTKSLKKIGNIAAARVVQPMDELTIISTGGVVLRTRVKDVKHGGRTTKCDLLINLEGGDNVASLARISTADLLLVGVKEGD
jgi:DNA gyrase subunit A